MGTEWHISGTINITPALSAKELKKAAEVMMRRLKSYQERYATPENVFSEYFPLKIMLDEFDKETDEGTLHVVRGIALVPSHDRVSMHNDLFETFYPLRDNLPGHNWDGEITAIHEDFTQAKRLKVWTEPGADTSTFKVYKGKTFVRWDGEGLADEEIVSLV